VFAAVQQNITGTPAPAWDAAGLLIRPDNTVAIYARLYDWFTGESLFPEGQPIVCDLNDSLNNGGARLFRWP
jgi:hypothetical protein